MPLALLVPSIDQQLAGVAEVSVKNQLQDEKPDSDGAPSRDFEAAQNWDPYRPKWGANMDAFSSTITVEFGPNGGCRPGFS
ncbi:hypothetical protein SDJN03_11602, partial [Cucurbita argyrosperma subsp. sororia]